MYIDRQKDINAKMRAILVRGDVGPDLGEMEH